MRPNGVWRVSGYLLLIEADQAIFPSSTFPDFSVSYIHINIVRQKIRKYSKIKKNQATPETFIISENSLPVTQVRQWNICDRVFTVETVKTSEIRKNLSHSYHLFLRAKLCSCNWVVCCVLLCRPHSLWPSVILFPRFTMGCWLWNITQLNQQQKCDGPVIILEWFSNFNRNVFQFN